jgi:hypothetical protein
MTDFKEYTDDKIIEIYRKARERKEAEADAFKLKQKPLIELMENLEGEAKRRMQERESDSFKTPSGTCFSVTKSSTSVKDKTAFFDWLQETGKWELADIRVAQKELKNFAEASNGELPPGVNMSQRVVAQFRAPTNK